MDALGPAVVVYFVLLVVLGAFFVVNLVVAVIYQAYVTEEAKEETNQYELQDCRERFASHATDETTPHAIDARTWKTRPRVPGLRLGDVATPDRSAALADFEEPQRTALKWWWKLRDVCCYVATRDAFNNAMWLAILLNTAVLVAEHDGQSRAQTKFTCEANDVLTS